MKNKHFYIICFSCFTLFLFFLTCAKKNDTTAPSIEDHIFSISDNFRVGDQVGQIEASDNNGVTEFNIEDGNMNNAFVIGNEGNLTIANISDFTTVNSYILTIKVSDQAGNSSMGQVMIVLTNGIPIIADQEYLISDTSMQGESIVQVVAYDIREMLEYRIKSAIGIAFTISNNGEIIVNDASSFATGEYILVIEVFDEIDNKANAIITITVKDTPPTIPDGQAFQVKEHSLSNTILDKIGSDNDKLLANDDRGIMEYRIIAGNDENAFKINNNGVLSLTGDVDIDFEAINQYILIIEVSDIAENKTKRNITINIIDALLANVYNVNYISTLETISSLTTALVSGSTYLFIADFDDDQIGVFLVSDNGTLTPADNIMDNETLELNGVREVTTASLVGTTYLFAAGQTDDGVSVFSVSNNGTLTSVDNVMDDETLKLRSASGITTAAINGTIHLFVTGQFDSGVSVFSVSNNGTLTSVDNVGDEMDIQNLHLRGAIDVTTASLNGTTYLFAAGQTDDGVSVFSVGNDGVLTSVDNVRDDGTLELDGVKAVTTASLNGTTYLFVAGFDDDGVSVFSVGNDGVLTSVDNVKDDGILELDGARNMTTGVINGTTYLFVVGETDDGVSVFSVGNDGVLTSVDNVKDDGVLELNGTVDVATALVGVTYYVFVASNFDNGVSVFRVETKQ